MSQASVKKRLNVRSETQRIRIDPLQGFLDLTYSTSEPGGVKERYEYAYYLYTSAMIRAFEQISALTRYNRMREQRKGMMSPGRKRVADKARALRPFFGLDMTTALIQTRILLDRVVAFSRAFLKGGTLPSFTSFADHKKFFVRDPCRLMEHIEYGRYMSENTEWFDTRVKLVRDKFIVHHGPKHFLLYTTDADNTSNVYLNVLELPAKRGHIMQHHKVNVWQLSYDVESYLKWFSNYAIAQVA